MAEYSVNLYRLLLFIACKFSDMILTVRHVADRKDAVCLHALYNFNRAQVSLSTKRNSLLRRSNFSSFHGYIWR